GGSLLDVSGISGIAGDDNNYTYNDSELFRGGNGSGVPTGVGGGGGGGGGRYRPDGNYGSNSGGDSKNDKNAALGVERSPRRRGQPRPGRTLAGTTVASASMPPPPPLVDTTLTSPRAASLGLGRGGQGRQAFTPGGSRAPTIDSFLQRGVVGNGGTGDAGGGGGGGGSGDGGNGRVAFGLGGDGALVGRAEGGMDVGVSGEWDAGNEDHFLKLIAEAQDLSGEAIAPDDKESDVQDVRCVCLQQPILLRGSQGRYLHVNKEEETVDGEEEDLDDNASIITAVTGISGDRAGSDWRTMFAVDAEGTGTGDPTEVVHFVSASERADRGAVVYGQSVSIRSVHAKGKYLRVSSSGAVIFGRVHLGAAERWRVLPYRTGGAPSSSG
ncbi:unnamed protein product, partial [Scytosiphon promiscuus]